ncbi:universal stress protein [Actinokineospora enzanensis]|uniref:universal stress protein n=1 Tax=Actinokineospora enzanensis TaxID=155975 RepID=UPI000372F2CF|nr:universal stress protein [Actinokineospora enzanensis]
MSGTRPVLAAVDGSESATRALVWAATEARRLGRELRVLTVYPWPVTGYPDIAATGERLRAGLRAQAQDVLAQARLTADETTPGLLVRTEALEGDAIGHLLAAGRVAEMLVLGSRGLGGFSGLLLGSTAVALTAHGYCPVVVVRGEEPAPGRPRVVVGVDGGRSDEAALAYVFDYAAATGATVVATHAWTDHTLDTVSTGGYLAVDWNTFSQQAEQELAARLAPWRAGHPEVEVESVVARARPARLLMDQAKGATLLVVGSRGRGGFAGLVLGSTSQALIHHAPCPVVVVRPDER